MMIPLVEMLQEAGASIMNLYNFGLSVQHKQDQSPVTAADLISHKVVTSFLLKHFAFPVLSEEGKSIDVEKRQQWETFWLVDPLDGTKEFINRNGEFTVNIALIKQGVPVMGIIYLPAKDILYYAARKKGAYKVENNRCRRLPFDQKREGTIVVGSRSHPSLEFELFVRKLQEKNHSITMVPAGSALKFCLVAEGAADLYPRLAPTMEWDTAAGQLIVEEAGGSVVEADNGRPLRYNKSDLENPHFIAIGRTYRGYN